jgi:hypothetical protein
VSLPAGSPLAALLDAPVRPGRLAWIGLRPARRAPMVAVESAELRPGEGLLGDRWRRPARPRCWNSTWSIRAAAMAGQCGQAAHAHGLREVPREKR